MSLVHLLLHISTAWAQVDCTQATLTEFRYADERAASLMMELDVDGLIELERTTLALVPCLTQRLPSEAIAAVHGMSAMASFADKRRGRDFARAALYAAGLASVDYTLPGAIPSQHPLRVMQAHSATFTGEPDATLIPSTGTTLLVDGVVNRPRTLTAPVIVQVIEGGALTATFFLAPAMSWSERE